jgi:hypothetical protein
MKDRKSMPKNPAPKKQYGNVVHGKCKKCAYYCKSVDCCDFYLTTKRHHDKIDETHGGCNEFWPARVRFSSKK